MEYILTAENVEKIIRKCLLKEDEITNGIPNCEFSIGEGIVNDYVFNTERLKECEEEIVRMIDELPEIDKGPSFLTLYRRKDGYHWGEHPNMEQLIVLGIATKNLSYCLPKDYWPILPGGMPFILKQNKEKDNSLTKLP